MNPAYLETHFEQVQRWNDCPHRFAIITAYATTGQKWSDEMNSNADCKLESELRSKSTWVQRLAGYSPSTHHAEPGWAVDVDFHQACEIGLRYRQNAIYYVEQDRLGVSFCDGRRGIVKIGRFRDRVHVSEA